LNERTPLNSFLSLRRRADYLYYLFPARWT